MAAVALVFSLAGKATPARAETFATDTVFATVAEIGQSISIAVDSDGVPHIAHTGQRAGEGLWYATAAGGVWVQECIRNLIYSQYTSIELDADGDPHIVFSGGPDFAVRYVRREGNDWAFETVDEGSYSYCSLELDADGNAHATYHQNRGLVYARRDAGGWTMEVVDAESQGRSASLDLDAASAPHIAYLDFRVGFNDLRYARKVGGAWMIEVVDDGPNRMGIASSLALDSLDAPHIAYRDATLAQLRYARKVGAVWVRQVVDDGAGIPTGSDASIAIGPGRSPRISYHRRPAPSYDGDLLYATRVGGAWEVSVVDTAGSVGRSGSIAVDGAGRTHIAYQLDRTMDLKYAVSALPTGVPAGVARDAEIEIVPNPAGLAGAEIRFHIAKAGSGALSIFDVSGRRVLVLREGTLAAGAGTIRWSGRDAAGRRVSPGIYFARLDLGALSRTERMVLLR